MGSFLSNLNGFAKILLFFGNLTLSIKTIPARPIYTLFGSLFMLLAFLVLFYQTGTSDLETLNSINININNQYWL